MRQLSYECLREQGKQGFLLEQAPERVLQFGEGNFLRGFVEDFVDRMNEFGGFNGKVVVCQPIPEGMSDVINEQQGLYTLCLRGMENGERTERTRIISSISRAINPYQNYQALLDCAHNPDLRFIVSNTTEAGIAFDPECRFQDAPPSSFPGKLTRFLFERFTAGLGGLIILSCELIDHNGKELRRCVGETVSLWGLSADFKNWLDQECLFCSTLVDRIVTGYPRAEIDILNQQNGYEDRLLDTGEVFALWVIEAPERLKQELPFQQAGLPVIVTPDHTPYKQRKVRILNGAHTSMVLAAHLMGETIVRECMQREHLTEFLRKTVYGEIIPTLSLPKEELEDFAESVFDRFANPFIDHALLAIALNSSSKWKARILPSLKAFTEQMGRLPACLTFSLAAYLAFYRAECDRNAKDEEWILKWFREGRALDAAALTDRILGCEKLWGEDLRQISGLTEAVSADLMQIESQGAEAAMKAVLSMVSSVSPDAPAALESPNHLD